MDTNFAPLLADMLIYSYEVDFITRASEEKRKAFTFTFCYIDDVLSLNNSKLGEFIDSINLTNMLSIKDSSIMMISVSENF
jgi:hypothetical protein